MRKMLATVSAGLAFRCTYIRFCLFVCFCFCFIIFSLRKTANKTAIISLKWDNAKDEYFLNIVRSISSNLF